MKKFFRSYLKIVLFLREDIYDLLARYDDDFAKRDILRMEWTSPNRPPCLSVDLLRGLMGKMTKEAKMMMRYGRAIFPEQVQICSC